MAGRREPFPRESRLHPPSILARAGPEQIAGGRTLHAPASRGGRVVKAESLNASTRVVTPGVGSLRFQAPKIVALPGQDAGDDAQAVPPSGHLQQLLHRVVAPLAGYVVEART